MKMGLFVLLAFFSKFILILRDSTAKLFRASFFKMGYCTIIPQFAVMGYHTDVPVQNEVPRGDGIAPSWEPL